MTNVYPLPTQQTTDNPFMTFWRLGYRRLIPIVPPNTPLNEKSSLAIRMRKNAAHDGRGKTPGILRDGVWQGTDLNKIEATIEDLIIWNDMKAGVGLKTGQGFHLIDADTQVVESARTVEQMIVNRIGKLPVRIGLWPKAGYLVRVRGDFAYSRVEFGERNEKGGLIDRVEILGEGKQFVAHGIHPKTLKPYTWPDGVPNFADIPEVEPHVLTELLADLARALPSAKAPMVEGGSGEAPPQNALRGDPALVRRAVEALPNTTDRFPSRESWRDIGYAIKASLPDDPDLALELFQDWSSKWDDGTDIDENGALIVGNDPDYVAAEFGRMKGPFRRGAPWLFEQAEQASNGAFVAASAWLDDAPAALPLFPPEEGTREARIAAGEDADALDEYRLLTIGDLLALPDPKFLIDRHVPERGTGILYGAPGTGKSFITLDATLSLAFGFERWQGNPINLNVAGEADGADGAGVREKVCVVYLAGEGAPGYKPRIMAWMQKHGIPLSEWERGRFALIDESVNFMNPDDVAKLVRSIKRRTGCRVAVLVVDTASRVLPGADENLQKDMSLFIDACRRLERALDCVVWGVHHTNKSGDMRGSSVIEGGADFIFSLERPKGASVGSLFCFKMKDGAGDAWTEKYRFDLVSIDGTANPQGLPLTSLVVERCSAAESAETGGLTPAKAMAVFTAIREAGKVGAPWSLRQNVKGGTRFYRTRMVEDHQIRPEAAESAMETWLSEGRVKEGIVDTKAKLKGLIVSEGVIPEPAIQSVFD